MRDLPSELKEARDLLRGVTPPPNAKVRVLRRLSRQARRPARGRSPVSPWVLAAALPVLLAATASALGLRNMLHASWHTTDAGSAVPTASPPSGGPLNMARPRPSHDRAPLTSEQAQSAPAPLPAPDDPPITFQSPSHSTSERPGPGHTAPLSQEATPARRDSTERSIGKAQSQDPAPVKTPSEDVAQLSAQVVAYQNAVSQLPDHPSHALAQLLAFRSRWPRSALAHEVDLRIVQTLLALGRTTDARAEAQNFLVRHPNSPRRADVEKIAGYSTSAASNQ